MLGDSQPVVSKTDLTFWIWPSKSWDIAKNQTSEFVCGHGVYNAWRFSNWMYANTYNVGLIEAQFALNEMNLFCCCIYFADQFMNIMF